MQEASMIEESVVNSTPKPAGRCQYKKECKDEAVAYCIFGSKEKGARPLWSGRCCIKHFAKLHNRYVLGGD